MGSTEWRLCVKARKGRRFPRSASARWVDTPNFDQERDLTKPSLTTGGCGEVE
jgi:hypothetical protein